MFLYELAIELGERSPDLVDAAAALGMGELLPASQLSAEQVAALKAHIAKRGPRAAGPGGAPPLPAPPSGPLVAGPPAGADGARAPSAPASWGPPAAPASWGPPVAAGGPAAWGPPTGATPPPPPPLGSSPGAVPTFEPPAEAAAPVAPPVGLDGVGLPPSPPTSWAAPTGTPTGPVAGAPGVGPEESGLSKGQIGAIAAAALLVVALFGFMIANTGPDEEREAAIAAQETGVDEEPETTLAATTTVPETTTSLAPDVYEPRDVEAFCRGGIAVATFELRLMAAIFDRDFAELQSLVRDRRAGWQSDVGVLASGAPPINVDDVELYQSGYNALFDAIESAGSMDQVLVELEQIEMYKASNAGQEWGRLVTFHCE